MLKEKKMLKVKKKNVKSKSNISKKKMLKVKNKNVRIKKNVK